MRCDFLREEDIADVQLLTNESDEAAVDEAMALFEQRKDKYNFSAFEVWAGARFVHRYPVSPPKYTETLPRSTADDSDT